MKKKLAGLFALLALALVVAAFASPAQEVKADVTGTGTKDDPYIVSTLLETRFYLEKNPGYVKLNNDILVEESVVSGSVSEEGYEGGIDLNGHIINLNGKGSSFRFLQINKACGNNAKFTVSDSNKTATHDNGPVDADGNSITGGIICNGSNFSGIVRMWGGSLYVDGGSYVDNTFYSTNSLFGFYADYGEGSQIGDVIIENVNFLRNKSEAVGAWSNFLFFSNGANKVDKLVLRNIVGIGNSSISATLVGAHGVSMNSALIEDCIFNDNSSKWYGSLYLSPTTLILKNLTMTGNKILGDPNSKNYYPALNYGGYGTISFDGKISIQENFYEDLEGNKEYRNFAARRYDQNVFADTFDITNSRIGIGSLNPSDMNNIKTAIADDVKYKDCFTLDQPQYGLSIKTIEGDSKVWYCGPQKFTVSYSMMSHGSQVSSETINAGEKFTKPEDPDGGTDYSFGGWYTSYDYTNEWDFDTVPTEDMLPNKTITLYAKWVKEFYTVYFRTPEEATSVSPANVRRNTTLTRPDDPTMEGYAFKGWYENLRSDQAWDFETDKVTQDNMYLYAKFESVCVYGVGCGENEVLLYNKETHTGDFPNPPAFRNYVFKGWYTLPIGGELLDTTNKDTLKSVYYAHWEMQDGTKLITVPLYFVDYARAETSTGVYSHVCVRASKEEFEELLDATDLAEYGIAYKASTHTFTINEIYADIYDEELGLYIFGENPTLNVVGTNILNVSAVLNEDGIPELTGIVADAGTVVFSGSGELVLDVDGKAIADSYSDGTVIGINADVGSFINRVPIYVHAYGCKGIVAGIIAEAGYVENSADMEILLGADAGISQSIMGGYGLYMEAEEILLNSCTIHVEAENLAEGGQAIGLLLATEEGEVRFPEDVVVTVENGMDEEGEVITTLESGEERIYVLFEDLTAPFIMTIPSINTVTGYYGDGRNPIILYDKANGISNLTAVPTYRNYVFDGWYTLPAGGEKLTLSEDTIPDGETTVYAQWKTADGRRVLEQTLAIALENYENLGETEPFVGVFFYEDNIVLDDPDDLADYGITVNWQSGKVVFDNVVIDIASGISEAYGVYIADDNAQIELKGTNRISVNDTWSVTGSIGILKYGYEGLTISGSGRLEMDIKGNADADESMAAGIFLIGLEFTNEADLSIKASRADTLYGIWGSASDIANAGNLSIVLGDEGDEESEASGIDAGKFTYDKGRISIELNNDSAPAEKAIAIEWMDGIVSNRTNKVTNAKDNLGKSITAIETFAETSYLVPKTKGSPVVIEVKTTPAPAPGPAPSPEPENPAPETPEPKKQEPIEYKVPVKETKEASVAAVIEDGTAEVGEISEQIINQTIGSGKDEAAPLVIDLSQSKNEVTEAVLTTQSIANVANAIADGKINGLSIVLNGASVTFDETAVKAVSKQAEGDRINLVVSKTKETELSTTQQNAVKDMNVQSSFEAYIECNGKRMHEFNGGSVLVTMDYRKPSTQNADYIHVYYVADDGSRERFNTTYKNGKLIFTTTHFSDYIIVYDEDDPNENHVEEAGINVTPKFGDLKAWSSLVAGKKLTISWNEIEGADGYEILASKCNSLGQKYKIRNIKTITSGDTTSYTMKSLKKGTFYKFKVRAYRKVNGKKVVIATTTLMHTVTNGGKYDVADYVQIAQIGNKTYKLTKKRKGNGAEYSYSLKKGKTVKITASEAADGKIAHHVGIRYESSNPEVATVDAEGNITALKKGSCEIYVYAQNGVYACVKLTVKM